MGPYGPIGPPGPIGPGPRGGVILGPMLGGPGGLLGSMPEESIGCPGCCNVQMYFNLIYLNLSHKYVQSLPSGLCYITYMRNAIYAITGIDKSIIMKCFSFATVIASFSSFWRCTI